MGRHKGSTGWEWLMTAITAYVERGNEHQDACRDCSADDNAAQSPPGTSHFPESQSDFRDAPLSVLSRGRPGESRALDCLRRRALMQAGAQRKRDHCGERDQAEGATC
jgi:hypothetical protein